MRSSIMRQCLFVFLMIIVGAPVGAAWRIDPARYHVSIHAEMACTECHADVSDPRSHPDPANVNRSIEEFFTADACADCHASVADILADGEHGGKAVNRPQDVENCLECHNPHEDLGYAASGKVDPDVPLNRQCGTCHETQDRFPVPDDDTSCMGCHSGLDKSGRPIENSTGFCLHCHADSRKAIDAAPFSVIDVKAFQDTVHGSIPCMTCHVEAAEYGHGDQPFVDCTACHEHHDETTAHDAHIGVACQACHAGGGAVQKDPQTGFYIRTAPSTKKRISRVHEMAIDGQTSCARCHYPGNRLGVSAVALPAKSLMCMPCHSASLTAGDWVTRAALGLFFLGMITLIFAALGGKVDGVAGEGEGRIRKLNHVVRKAVSAVFSSRIRAIGSVLFWDVLCQRRLYNRSFKRWAVHALIFYPFVIRFAWGVAVLFLAAIAPDMGLTRAMLDKNHPVGALLFDATGLMVIAGVGLASALKKQRHAEGFQSMPAHDWAASGLLAAIVLAGFILEGARIAMTGFPMGAQWAFAGYGLAKLFHGMTAMADIYAYLWYAHAVFTGLFVAYLPFSRMLHMITAPVFMAVDTLDKQKEHK